MSAGDMRGLLEQRLGKFLVKVRPDEFQPMLAYLRGLAPEVEGRP